MTDKHTPGPWKIITLDGETYINPARVSGEYALIAQIQQEGHPANARLIASAPELLETLEKIAADADDALSDEYPLDAGSVAHRARAAIKAAKGDA
jgi:hypothetical protein